MTLDLFKLTGQIALITGAAQGIGKACAEAYAEAGAKLVLVDINQEKLEETTSEFKAKSFDVYPLLIDVTDPKQVTQMVQKSIEHYGKLDIAVNNAGVCFNSPAETTNIEEWDDTFNLNLRSVFLCCQAEAQAMLKQGAGKIINTASMASLIVPHPQKQAAYNASKSGVVQLTRSLATEWANQGVHVNCISPGIIKTELIESEQLKPLVSTWLEQIPLHRLAKVEELKGAFIYLASQASNYMIGHNLVVDGGQSVW